MSIIEHVDAAPSERAAYLKRSAAERRLLSGNGEEEEIALTNEEIGEEAQLSDERYEFLRGHEQFVLTVSSKGFGKRSSSFEFRTSGRGGKGIVAMVVNDRNGRLLASFPIDEKDQIMLVTDGGQLIRCPVDGVRIAGRNTQGVRIFKTEAEEKVVSVERITEDETDEGSEGVSP